MSISAIPRTMRTGPTTIPSLPPTIATGARRPAALKIWLRGAMGNSNASLVLGFAVLSLILASVGLYGVLSYLTTQRTGEVGVRMALGAKRGQVLRLLLGEGLRPALYGLTFGLATSIGAVRIIQSMLYGTRPLDPVIFTAVAATLLTVAALACLVPAWRASRIEPMQALRTE